MKANSDAEIQGLLANSTGLVQVSHSCQSLCLLQPQRHLPPLHADNQTCEASVFLCDKSEQQHCTLLSTLLIAHAAPSAKLASMQLVAHNSPIHKHDSCIPLWQRLMEKFGTEAE